MEDLLCCPTLRRVFQTEPNPFAYESGSLLVFTMTCIFFYLGMDTMVFSVATVKLLLGFIGWNMYLM